MAWHGMAWHCDGRMMMDVRPVRCKSASRNRNAKFLLLTCRSIITVSPGSG
jgi:hypothetical protein